MDAELLDQFDAAIEPKGYETRSEAIRDMVRNYLAEESVEQTGEAVATVSLVYNHHVRNLTAKLTAVQHNALDMIASALHVHLDADRCLEVLVLRGPYSKVRELADKLISIKGVKYGKFVTTTGRTEDGLSNGHPHTHAH